MFPIDEDTIEKLKEFINKAKDIPIYPEKEYDYAMNTWVNRNPSATEIANIKAEKIKWIKAKAGEEINNAAPVWKQINLMRVWVNGGTKDARFDQIDAIRTKSDQLEAQVNAATTVTEINAVVW